MSGVFSKEAVAFSLRAAATISAGVLFGAGVHASVIAHPSYLTLPHLGCGVAAFLANHNLEGKRYWQTGLVAFSSLCGIASFFVDDLPDSWHFLAGGVILLHLFPYNMSLVSPVCEALADKEANKEKSDEWKVEMLTKWSKLNAGRCLLSGSAYAFYLGHWLNH